MSHYFFLIRFRQVNKQVNEDGVFYKLLTCKNSKQIKYVLDLLTESLFSHLHPTKLSLTIFVLKTPHKHFVLYVFPNDVKLIYDT